MSIDPDDGGAFPAGVIFIQEVGSEHLRVGDHVIAVVTQPEAADGRIVLR